MMKENELIEYILPNYTRVHWFKIINLDTFIKEQGLKVYETNNMFKDKYRFLVKEVYSKGRKNTIIVIFETFPVKYALIFKNSYDFEHSLISLRMQFMSIDVFEDVHPIVYFTLEKQDLIQLTINNTYQVKEIDIENRIQILILEDNRVLSVIDNISANLFNNISDCNKYWEWINHIESLL